MKFISFPTFLNALFVTFLGLLVYSKNRENPTHRSFFFLCSSIAVWFYFASFAYSASSRSLSEFYLRVCYIGIVNIPTTVFHFSITFLNIKRLKKILSFLYGVSFIFAISVLTSNFLIKGVYCYSWGYYPAAGILHPYFLMFFGTTTTYCAYLFIRSYFTLEAVAVRRTQIKYVLISFLFYNLAVFDFIPNYGVSIFPIGFVAVSIFLGIIGYSVVKYRLLDISLIITRTSIFIAVYSFVLGAPFALAFGWQQKLIDLFGLNWWIVPLISSTVLATAGPFIYLYIQKKAEDKLLREQRQYQTTLRQASMGMGQIKDLKRLLQLIVHIVTRAVSVEHCKIFLMHEESKQLILKASRGKQSGDDEVSVLALDCPLINHLKKIKEPVVYEEIKQQAQDYKNSKFKPIEIDISKVNGALVAPSFIDQKLIALLVLGKKKSGELYTQDDLAVFSILANQAGLAIENAQFYERMKVTHMQLLKAEKMATVGTMADGLSHQINNRLHAMGFIAGDALDTIRLKREKKLSKDMKAFLDEIERSFSRIEDNVKRGGEVVEGLLKYTRKGEEGFEIIDLNKLLDAALEMVQFKIKLNEMDFVRNFDDNIPNFQGNFTQMQEVFFNIIDNAYDAMMQRKNELKEPGYEARLEICADQKNRKLEILIKDNGIGVRRENLEKLFTPFFTTKLSSKKGTGLGLYVIRQIIEENHGGKVRFTSQYEKGSQTRILLPIAVKS